MFVTGPVLTAQFGRRSGSPAMASTPVRASSLAPAPDISAFIPSNYRVTSVMKMDLDGNGDNEEAITAVGVPDKWGYVPTTVVLIAWDTLAKRWTKKLDAVHSPLPSQFAVFVGSGSWADLYTARRRRHPRPAGRVGEPRGIGAGRRRQYNVVADRDRQFQEPDRQPRLVNQAERGAHWTYGVQFAFKRCPHQPLRRTAAGTSGNWPGKPDDNQVLRRPPVHVRSSSSRMAPASITALSMTICLLRVTVMTPLPMGAKVASVYPPAGREARAQAT